MDESKKMTSPAKQRANRLNALRSTGPRTEAGKESSSGNSTRHGLLSEKYIVLPGEDAAEFEHFEHALKADLAAEGELEECLVARITACAWRLRRILRIEGTFFVYHTLDQRAATARVRASSLRTVSLGESLGDLDFSQPRPEDQAAYREANNRASELESERDEVPLVPAFIRDSAGPDAFDKLSRYETRIERSLYRALHELQRLQALRRGEPVSSPAVVDVDVSGVNH